MLRHADTVEPTMGLSQKLARQRKILHIVRTQSVRTQAALGAALREAGFPVSQPTLSKDIAELGLVKVPLSDSGYRYQAAREGGPEGQGRRLHRALREFLLDWERAGQILVLKTIAGHAAGVAWALDEAKWPEVVGTVAGEDTLLVVARTAAQARKLGKHLEEVLRG